MHDLLLGGRHLEKKKKCGSAECFETNARCQRGAGVRGVSVNRSFQEHMPVLGGIFPGLVLFVPYKGLKFEAYSS